MKAHLLAAVLALSGPAMALDLEAMTEAERDAFRAEVRAYLLDNPEVLMEAIQVLEDRNAAAQAQTDQTLLQSLHAEIFQDPDSWVGGNPDGDVTVVEFLDYRCGYCKRAHPEVTELLAADGNIRLIVKEFPILGEQSVLASRFAIAVRNLAGDAVYGQAHEALMTFRGDITQPALDNLANRLGLDPVAVALAMADPDVDAVIAANHALAQKLAINGTPGFIFESQLVRGYIPLDAMTALIAEVRG